MNGKSSKRRWGKITAALTGAALGIMLTAASCGPQQPCTGHGGVKSWYYEGNQVYYTCNDGSTA